MNGLSGRTAGWISVGVSVLASLGVVVLGCQGGSAHREVKVAVTEKGFEPSEIRVKGGDDVVLAITRETDVTCATDVTIDDGRTRTDLPLNQTVRVPLGVVSGERQFACGMGMYKGKVIAE